MWESIKKVEDFAAWKEEVQSMGDLIEDDVALGVKDADDPNGEGYFAIWLFDKGFGFIDTTKDEWSLMEYLRFNL